jgi:hypothetical protein
VTAEVVPTSRQNPSNVQSLWALLGDPAHRPHSSFNKPAIVLVRVGITAGGRGQREVGHLDLSQMEGRVEPKETVGIDETTMALRESGWRITST